MPDLLSVLFFALVSSAFGSENGHLVEARAGLLVHPTPVRCLGRSTLLSSVQKQALPGVDGSNGVHPPSGTPGVRCVP